jgi:hypothetical protein
MIVGHPFREFELRDEDRIHPQCRMPDYAELGCCECCHYCVQRYFVRHNPREYASNGIVPHLVASVNGSRHIGTDRLSMSAYGDYALTEIARLNSGSLCGQAPSASPPDHAHAFRDPGGSSLSLVPSCKLWNLARQEPRGNTGNTSLAKLSLHSLPHFTRRNIRQREGSSFVAVRTVHQTL